MCSNNQCNKKYTLIKNNRFLNLLSRKFHQEMMNKAIDVQMICQLFKIKLLEYTEQLTCEIICIIYNFNLYTFSVLSKQYI